MKRIKRKKQRNLKAWFLVVFCIVIILPAAWILIKCLEGTEPELQTDLSFSSIGASKILEGTFSDTKSGVRKIFIGITDKDNKPIVLMDKTFPSAGLFTGGKSHQEAFSIRIEPAKLGIPDGKATLQIAVRDYSWRKWWHGNQNYIEKEITIDTVAPGVEVLSSAHNVSQGGSGLAIYRLSESCPKSGVMVGENFFPGHNGYADEEDIYICFFALTDRQGKDTKISVRAVDEAGNSSRAGISYYIKKKVFKKDIIRISDNFLNWKMPELTLKDPADAGLTGIEKFIKINNKTRQENYDQFVEICSNPDGMLYWKGSFLRMPNTARKSSYADRRDYLYDGKVVDHQTHMGVDLASNKHAPVPASNHGRVIFTGDIGIYGKTVVIDHGFGLFSMYSHLSSIGVEKDQMVTHGEIIGLTGTTGFAGGDHLHLGMMVHNTFVNPVEWWDGTWIKNNITHKLDGISPKSN
ncbi:MAG: M23 family metallopeptidase [Desulfobacterales bacterium]|nr:M23 family metallopeptidase [Desulfobacterales bacterium]